MSSTDDLKRKILQIIPAERGWKVGWLRNTGSWLYSELAAWALIGDGRVLPLVVNDGGELALAEDVEDGEVHLFDPGQSWQYAVTVASSVGKIEAPTRTDWEAINVSASADGAVVLWRRPSE